MADWFVTEETFIPEDLLYKETVFTLGNGYLGTRGSFEEGYPGALPATLIHGVYDDLPPANTELANAPDWTWLSILIEGEAFRMDRGKVLSYRRCLDMRRGVLSRDVPGRALPAPPSISISSALPAWRTPTSWPSAARLRPWIRRATCRSGRG